MDVFRSGGFEEEPADFYLVGSEELEEAQEFRRCAADVRAHDFLELILRKVALPVSDAFLSTTWGIGTRRAGKLYRARSRLYRRQTLQVNIRWKALDEIYKICMLLHRSDLNVSANFHRLFWRFQN